MVKKLDMKGIVQPLKEVDEYTKMTAFQNIEIGFFKMRITIKTYTIVGFFPFC